MEEVIVQEKLDDKKPKLEQPEKKKHKPFLSVKDICLISIFAALIAVCSWISIPLVVSFTMQTFAIFLAIGVLGGFKGTMAILIYILLGLIGVPVFANFQGGVAHLLGPTGGYIVGFLLTGLFMWALEKPFWKKNIWFMVIAMVLGLIICYACGTIWFEVVYINKGESITIWNILMTCVIPFIIPDLAKIALAVLICKRLKKAIKIE